jgi:excisionase family DNA binding protein
MTQPQRRALKILPKPEPTPIEPLLTVAQVAEILAKSTDAVRMMARRGQIPAVRMGARGIRFKREDIRRYLDELEPL